MKTDLNTPNMRKGAEFFTCIITLVLALAGLVVSSFSYTTGYYVFGELHSVLVVICLAAAILLGLANLLFGLLFPEAHWHRFLTLLVSVVLVLAIVYTMGDRFEGIGQAILTDYDAGHGAEEAIYFSIAACCMLGAALISNLVGGFFSVKKPAAVPGSDGTAA